jgi:hypothetical protein
MMNNGRVIKRKKRKEKRKEKQERNAYSELTLS